MNQESPSLFKETTGGLLEYCGPTDDPSLVVEKWRELDATIDMGIWGQASIAAKIQPVYGHEDMKQFADAVEKHVSYVRRMAKTYDYYMNQKKTWVSGLSFKHHSIALRHHEPLEALNTASLNGWGCVKLEEWIINEAVDNPKVTRAVKQQRQNDFRVFLERVDDLILNDLMASCPNAEWGRRVFKSWRDDVAWELSQIAHAETADRVADAIQSGAHTIPDIRSATGLPAKEIEGVIGIKVAEGVWEWVREGGETDMARGSRRTIIHVVGTVVAR